MSDDKKFLCRKNAEGEARSPEMVKGWLTGWSSLLTSEIVQRHLSVGSVYKRSGIVEWNSSGALEEQLTGSKTCQRGRERKLRFIVFQKQNARHRRCLMLKANIK